RVEGSAAFYVERLADGHRLRAIALTALGDYIEAARSIATSHRFWRLLDKTSEAQSSWFREWQMGYAECKLSAANMLSSIGEVDAARVLFDQAAEVLSTVVASDPLDLSARALLSQALRLNASLIASSR